MTDGSGHTTAYGYDDAGHMTSLTDADGGAARSGRTTAGPPHPARPHRPHPHGQRRLDVRRRGPDGHPDRGRHDHHATRTIRRATGSPRAPGQHGDHRGVRPPGPGAHGRRRGRRHRRRHHATRTASRARRGPIPPGRYTATLDNVRPDDRPTIGRPGPGPAGAGHTAPRARSHPPDAGQRQHGHEHASTRRPRAHRGRRRPAATTRAAYAWAYNRAGLVLSEASTITGDPSNGTIAYAYDPLGRLHPPRAPPPTPGTPPPTGPGRRDRPPRPTTPPTARPAARVPTAPYGSDADGRLTARPGQTHDLGPPRPADVGHHRLGHHDLHLRSRSTACAPSQAPDGFRTRFRYTGLTTSAAQSIDDVAGTVTRSIGNGWAGERLLDWTGTGTDRRYYGTNAHHDITWLADSTGAVSASLRYDPWGVPRSTVPTGYTPFRFQGSWHDAAHRPRLGRHPLVRADRWARSSARTRSWASRGTRLPAPLRLRGGGAGGEVGPGWAMLVAAALHPTWPSVVGCAGIVLDCSRVRGHADVQAGASPH